MTMLPPAAAQISAEDVRARDAVELLTNGYDEKVVGWQNRLQRWLPRYFGTVCVAEEEELPAPASTSTQVGSPPRPSAHSRRQSVCVCVVVSGPSAGACATPPKVHFDAFPPTQAACPFAATGICQLICPPLSSGMAVVSQPALWNLRGVV